MQQREKEFALPSVERPAAEVLAEFQDLMPGLCVRNPSTSSIDDVVDVGYLALLREKILPPDVPPGLALMERSIIAAAAHHLGGGPLTRGIFTSGGSESILLAMRLALDEWEGRTPRTRQHIPFIVVPNTIHPSVHKGARYLGLKVKTVPVGLQSGVPDADYVTSVIDEDTALIVLSATSACHGTVDPIQDIAAFTAKNRIPLHVDACAGGWVLPWLAARQTGTTPFDLSVSGVTSLSVDLHKFGPVPPLASLLLLSEPGAWRRLHFTWTRWPGYIIVGNSIASTRPAAPVGASWIALQCTGESGYLRLAGELLAKRKACEDALNDCPVTEVLGHPEGASVAFFVSEKVDPFYFGHALRALSVPVATYLSFEDSGPLLRINVNKLDMTVAEDFPSLLAASLAETRGRIMTFRTPTQAQAVLSSVPMPSAIDRHSANLSSVDQERALNLLTPEERQDLVLEYSRQNIWGENCG
jgi:glutamate/tyrosine decarboxylase-like PLP-dependent enzyme